MRSRNIVSIGFLLALAALTPAGAADVGIGLRGGTQGLGAELAVGFTKYVALRGGYHAYDISEDVDEGGIEYDGTLRLGNYGLLVDVFPLGGRFHLSAGVVANRNEIEVEATPTEPQEIGGMVYEPAEIGTLSGAVEFDEHAPYVGIGWGNVARGGRVGFLIDFGVIRQGSGEVSLVASNGMVDPADLAAEAAEIEEDISDYDLFPIISLGLAIRF